MATPRGRITFSGRSIDIGGAEARGPFPAVIVYLRASSGRAMRQFHCYCRTNGLHAVLVQAPDAWEVIGHPDDLEGLLEHPAVREWHYILDVKPPRGSQGSGDMSENARKSIRRSKMWWVEREALEETERRAKLRQDQRLDIELLEAQQREALAPVVQ